ncbi:MAG: COX15/CtaA family protein [Pseudomonadales bacterium]|nr:COX15/CtaA family protein [Pseudomonadales bacterium]
MTQSRKIVVIWLSIVCFTIFAMVVVGGITRLTNSGLSMVDWRPIMGVIPPLSQEEWQETFDMYKQFPEYQQVNRHLDLEGFKRIFYWEYGHRVLGRLIGVIFFVPFVLLWVAGRIEKPVIPKLLVALVLGGLQGLMGWYMVKSGLVDMPRVSHYRLAAHLLLALLILGYLFWLILDLLDVRKESVSRRFALSAKVLLGLVTLQILYGAFTAGIRAGFGFNTFPKMHDQWVADAVFMMDPWWINLFESSATIQFVHRWLGIRLVAVTVGVWLWAWRRWRGSIHLSAAVLTLILLAQVVLGILTLVYVVPISLASLHQAVACLLLLSGIHLVYISRSAE